MGHIGVSRVSGGFYWTITRIMEKKIETTI